jgi:nucleotide-binding universal stress UspA family protein
MEGYKTILVPLDGSEVSEAILPEIERLATAFKASIFLLRVAYIDPIVYGVPYETPMPFEDPNKLQAAAVREAEEYLSSIKERLKAKGLTVKSHVVYGHDAEEILDLSSQKDIDLIAMSTHGRSGVKRWLLGSVAEKVLRHATKPILLVRSTG